MSKRAHYHSNLIFAVGTQVVTLKDIFGPNGRTLHPRGSVGVITKAPSDLDHLYRVRFPDGVEEAFQQSTLPEQPGGEAALNDLLIRARLQTQGG